MRIIGNHGECNEIVKHCICPDVGRGQNDGCRIHVGMLGGGGSHRLICSVSVINSLRHDDT